MSAPSLFVSECHGAYITPIPGTDGWRCHDCDEPCTPIRHDQHPRWAQKPPENDESFLNHEGKTVRPVGGHYKPGDWGASPICTVCGMSILDDEDWEGDGRDGAQHRIPPKGCVKAVAREVLLLKEKLNDKT